MRERGQLKLKRRAELQVGGDALLTFAAVGPTFVQARERIYMRTLFAMLVISLAIMSRAQTAPSASADPNARTLMPPPLNQNLIFIRVQKPNEIRLNRVTYDGIFVHFAKRENPLQLINPAAPPPYASMDNVVLDPITRRGTGLKLFSISF